MSRFLKVVNSRFYGRELVWWNGVRGGVGEEQGQVVVELEHIVAVAAKHR